MTDESFIALIDVIYVPHIHNLFLSSNLLICHFQKMWNAIATFTYLHVQRFLRQKLWSCAAVAIVILAILFLLGLGLWEAVHFSRPYRGSHSYYLSTKTWPLKRRSYETNGGTFSVDHDQKTVMWGTCCCQSHKKCSFVEEHLRDVMCMCN